LVSFIGAMTMTGCSVFRPLTTDALGAARTNATLLEWGNLDVPATPRPKATSPGGQGGAVGALIQSWADEDLPPWQEEGKVTAPRVALAKLATGTEIPEVNDYLQRATPWANIGSTWGLRPNGDYDFSLPPLTAILYLYGDNGDTLYPETRDHLLSVLLNQDGGGFSTTVPGSLGLVTETENHILMTEGSRYLKNQWLRRNGDDRRRYNNSANGMEEKLIDFIDEMNQAGPYEFNSTPYQGYTAMALLTLEAFADEAVAAPARRLLDRMNFEYALGSHSLRRYAPFRRQPKRADRRDLANHPHTAMMAVWTAQTLGSEAEGTDVALGENRHHAVYAALMPYRLPEPIAARTATVDRRHFARIGRGPEASPEIYSAGPGYLLSAGGTGRPEGSLLVARPTVLFLDDAADNFTELFALGGAGDRHGWNNTGVLADFAVGTSPLQVPEDYQAAAEGETWKVYAAPASVGTSGSAPAGTLLVAAGDTGATAAIFVSPMNAGENTAAAASELLAALDAGSPAGALDSGTARLPDGRSVDFDLAADADTWVITAIDGSDTERGLTQWSRLQGSIER
jgi:hypothetical protein